MTELEIEELNEIQNENEILKSIPIIDFISNPICDNFELNGKITYIYY